MLWQLAAVEVWRKMNVFLPAAVSGSSPGGELLIWLLSLERRRFLFQGDLLV